ncbi:hypothetical protein DFH27DRAFT_579248 [Peziza echinospora]|nr:hypothetical protein DFH27DRAFT_579248 [Peziza echinospora]
MNPPSQPSRLDQQIQMVRRLLHINDNTLDNLDAQNRALNEEIVRLAQKIEAARADHNCLNLLLDDLMNTRRDRNSNENNVRGPAARVEDNRRDLSTRITHATPETPTPRNTNQAGLMSVESGSSSIFDPNIRRVDQMRESSDLFPSLPMRQWQRALARQRRGTAQQQQQQQQRRRRRQGSAAAPHAPQPGQRRSVSQRGQSELFEPTRASSSSATQNNVRNGSHTRIRNTGTIVEEVEDEYDEQERMRRRRIDRFEGH